MIEIGDLVSIPIDAVGERYGKVVKIREKETDLFSYLVLTPKGYQVWIGKQQIKLVQKGEEKVEYT